MIDDIKDFVAEKFPDIKEWNVSFDRNEPYKRKMYYNSRPTGNKNIGIKKYFNVDKWSYHIEITFHLLNNSCVTLKSAICDNIQDCYDNLILSSKEIKI